MPEDVTVVAECVEITVDLFSPATSTAVVMATHSATSVILVVNEFLTNYQSALAPPVLV